MSHSARLCVAALLLIALPVAARAQVGGLINKAKQAVAEKTAKPVGSDEHIGDPFDDASLSSALTGMRAFKAKMNEVAAIQAQYLDNQQKRSALQDNNKKVISDYEASRYKSRDCIGQFISANAPDREALMQKKMMALMNDQAALVKFTTETGRLSQAYRAAVAKNDTAAIRTTALELAKLAGEDPAADTAAAVKKCGAIPARPAVLQQIDQMEKRSDDLNKQLRTTESSSDSEGARAAGVTPARFAQMKERLTQFVDNGKVFGGKEGDLLRGHQSEIQKLVKTP